MSKLVIVESPAKAKNIKGYLGRGYEVIASMGHVRDLPAARLSVDIANDFEPKYAVIKGKESFVKDLKKKADSADYVYLATDPDREGEAISWHLATLLDLDMNEKNRVTFNEITKNGVKNGMAQPRAIDIDFVNAQQARRILDRLIGYKLSPFISQKIRRGLSAGRVQSVALRLIVDREEEIRAFKPEEYWSIDAKFTNPPDRKTFAAAIVAFLALGCGLIIIAFLVFKAINVLNIAVDVGFVVGITAATKPIGSASFLIPNALSSSTTPHVLVSL